MLALKRTGTCTASPVHQHTSTMFFDHMIGMKRHLDFLWTFTSRELAVECCQSLVGDVELLPRLCLMVIVCVGLYKVI